MASGGGSAPASPASSVTPPAGAAAVTPLQAQGGLDYSPHIFQHLMDLKGSVSKLDERTDTLTKEISNLRSEMKGVPGYGAFWTGVLTLVTTAFAIAGILWFAVSAKLEAIEASQRERLQDTIRDAVGDLRDELRSPPSNVPAG